MVFDRVTIKNFLCVRDLTLALTPMHALIGPNDSGKTTILSAIRTALHFAASTFTQSRDATMVPFAPTIPEGCEVSLEQVASGLRYVVNRQNGLVTERLCAGSQQLIARPRVGWNAPGILFNHTLRT